MEKKKRIKRLDGLKCDVDQYVMVTMDFTPPSVYRHLQVTIIYDDGWCWALIGRKLSFLILDCLPLKDIASVQLVSMSNYIDVLQSVPQVKGPNEHIYGHVHNLSDI